jgi:molybdopterin converting factor small subunit
VLLMGKMHVILKFFSFFQDLMGVDQMSVDLPEGTTVSDVFDLLSEPIKRLFPDEKQVILMVNDKHASPETILKDGDVLRFLPVLGGG